MTCQSRASEPIGEKEKGDGEERAGGKNRCVGSVLNKYMLGKKVRVAVSAAKQAKHFFLFLAPPLVHVPDI